MYSKAKVLVMLLVLLAITLACGQPINNQELPTKELPTLATNTPPMIVLHSGAELAANKPMPTPETCVVTGSLNMRRGIGADAPHFITLEDGTVAVIIERGIADDMGLWYRVEAGGFVGWINGRWCRKKE